MPRLTRIAIYGLLVAILMPQSHALAKNWTDMLDFSGHIQSDIRFSIENYRGAKNGEGYKFQTNRNDVEIRLKFRPNARVEAVIDARLRFYGINQPNKIADLYHWNKVEAFNLQLNDAYLAVHGWPSDMVDFKLGNMIQQWGTADLFNPTDNLNARDFSDPLDYTAKVPNQMIEFDIYPTDWLSLTAVWVPVFRPALLPPSTGLAFAVDTSRDGCFVGAPVPPLQRSQVKTLENMFGQINPCSLHFNTPEMNTMMPDLSIANSQVGLKARFQVGLGDVGDINFSLSYYYGRFTFPVAYTAVANLTDDLVNAGVIDVNYTVNLMYPRMQVAGFDFSYSADSPYVPGIFGEMAVIFPEKVVFGLGVLRNNQLVNALSMSNVNVDSTPFVKATVGMDYTFASWLYMNVQYVRGFFDEFNDAYGIHNYLVPDIDFKFLDDALKFRLAGAWNLDDLSAAVFPQIMWIPAPSVEMTLGVWLNLGDTKSLDPQSYAGRSKFGQKAAGRSVAYLKAKFNW